MMLLGMGIHAAPPAPWWTGLLGCVGAFGATYPLWVLGVMKGGDAKLTMGVGACLGWQPALETLVWWAVLYVPVGLVALAVQGRLGNLKVVWKHVTGRFRQRSGGPDPGPAPEVTVLRTGPVIAAAGVLAWATDWLDLVR
jgi:Flp pilus assembly protein protease CpaA